MKYPEFIKSGNCIGVPVPSAGASTEPRINKMMNAKKRLEELDYHLKLSKNLLKCEKGRSASARKRAEEINEMFQDKDVDMILCASGGDFLIEMLPYVNFELIQQNPKLVAGFSDPTGLLFPITSKYDIATIYGQNFSSLGTETLCQAQQDFLEMIKGTKTKVNSCDFYENEGVETITGIEPYNLTEKVYWQTLNDKPLSLQGRIIGGCFDLIAELAGTKYDGTKEFNERYKEDGIIWFFDNAEMSKEETIRILWKLNELEYFKYTKGVIFGRFGVETTYYDYDVKTCLQDSILNELEIPVIYDADISHKAPCIPIINGSIAKIDVKDGKATISYQLK